MYNKQYPGYITMTIVTGNETFPELNITKENLVEDQLPVLVKFGPKYILIKSAITITENYLASWK